MIKDERYTNGYNNSHINHHFFATIYHFDDEIGFIHLDGEKVTDETLFAVAEKMVADFMEIESYAWQRRKREWLNGDDK